MKVGIWQGSTPERVHVDAGGRPLCGAHTRTSWGDPSSTGAFWKPWDDTLRAVDCRRCLIMMRRRLREDAELVEQRLNGRGGIQVDIEEIEK